MRRGFVLGLVVLVLLATAGIAVAANQTFRAHLAGRHEVPPVDTRAQGQATLKLTREGEALRYKLIVSNIANVTQALAGMGGS